MTKRTKWMLAAAVTLMGTGASLQMSGQTVSAQERQQARLQCAWPGQSQPHSDTTTIGPAGGTIRVRSNQLQVAAGALAAPVRFTMRELGGDSVGVLITPSVTFAVPATIRIDVGAARCARTIDRDRWFVWRFPEGGGAPERLATERPAGAAHMVGTLTNNSYIIIAD